MSRKNSDSLVGEFMFEVIEKRDFGVVSSRGALECALVMFDNSKYLACISEELFEDKYSDKKKQDIYNDVMDRFQILLNKNVGIVTDDAHGIKYVILGNDNY